MTRWTPAGLSSFGVLLALVAAGGCKPNPAGDNATPTAAPTEVYLFSPRFELIGVRWHICGMTNEQKLEEQIELAMAEYLRASQESAKRAMQRAFVKAGAPPAASGPTRVSSKASGRRQRRSTADLAVLGEKLLAAVRMQPGESMKTLASQIGASPSELQGTVLRLKRECSLRVVGKRQYTRYFPATETSQEMAA